MSRTRDCQIPGCDTIIRAKLLMCHLHWIRVPHHIRDAVNHEHRLWREAGQDHPTVGYLKAARQAIDYVAGLAEKAGEANAERQDRPTADSPDYDARC